MAPRKRSQTSRYLAVAETSSDISPIHETNILLSDPFAREHRPPSGHIRTLSSTQSPSQYTAASTLSPIVPDFPHSPVEAHSPESTSRRASTSTMRTSSVSLEGPPTSTPTGRISKAKKGKRVHACEFPGCGKVFTRAEHRRRHELNHNPEALFPCTRPGCRKSFHRVDLLQRHQERHDLESAVDASSAHMSELSHLGATSELPSSVIPAPVMNSPEAGRSTPKSSSGGLSIGSLVNPQGDYRYSLGTPAFNGFAQQPMHYVSGFNSTDDTIFYTPESSQSPVSDYYGRYRHRQSISSSSSITAVDPSGASPLITGNIPGSWAPSSVQPPSMLPSNMLDEDSSLPVSLSDLDGYEWSVIRRELSNAPGLLPRDASTGIPDTMRWHCLDYYWRYFHPHFPIVHRPTFLPTKPSPLLASAMAAIGSQYDDRPDSKLYSLTLLEIATKLLKKRASITSRSRLADLQTVFLLEVLGKYCARRVEVEMSARFRSFFASLDQARRVLATDALAVFRTLPEDRTKDDVNRAYKFWLEHETRRRILQASTILDLQQVTLFEQQPTIVQHERPRQGSLNLRCTIPLPCSEELWETSPIEAWVEVASRIDASKQVINQKVEGLPPSNMPLDFFQIQVSIAANPELPFDAFFPLSREDQANELGARLTFNHHLREMARHTPIRHLLVVSGESWVLGKKLENEAEFQMAKHDLRAWVNANRESRIALRHATQLIRSRAVFIPSDQTSTDLVPSFLDTHMLHEPWGLYLASLVCWAYGLSASTMLEAGDQVSGVASASTSASEANSQMSRSSSSSMPSTYPTLLDPHAAAYSMRQYLHNTDVGTAEDLVRLDAQVFGQTRGLLEMVRLHKVGHFLGGLMNEAERVLYRLVEGRSRLSHF